MPLARIDAQTRSGDITLSLPAAAKFDLTASTSRGDVTNDFGSPIRAESDGRGSALRASIPGGVTVTVHTEHGEVVVRKASPEDKPLMPKNGETQTQIPARAIR